MKVLGLKTGRSLVFGMAMLVGATASAAQGTFSLDGDVEVVSGSKKNQKVLLLESDATEGVPFAAIEYTPRLKKNKVLELQDLKKLSVTYQVIAGGIGGGSPRFAIALDVDGDGDFDGNVNAYIGDPPNFNSGTTSLRSSGNLLADGELRFDATQLGGDFYMTYDEVLAEFADAEVLGVTFAVDGSFAVSGGVQAVVVTELRVNNDKLNIRKIEAELD